MEKQPKNKSFSSSSFFADGSAARTLVVGTVASSTTSIERPPLSAALLIRGQQRYHIYCTACHDRTGTGAGLAVQRGFPRPPSFHTESSRALSDQGIFDVISSGEKQMPGFNSQILSTDRWAIVAYIRALQLSQNAARTLLSPDDLIQVDGASR